MEDKKTSQNKIIIGVLIALLLASLGYTYYNNTQHIEQEAFFIEEKENIQGDLDRMIEQYDEAIAENSSLSDELIAEREQIILFRDSIKNLKDTNVSLIRRYRNKIRSLEITNQELFEMNEELVVANQDLNTQIDSANVFIENQNIQIDTLSIQNNNLSDQVAIGALLKVNAVKVNSMRERNNGKLVETSRANRTDMLRVSFRIAENLLTEEGDKKAVVQILNPAGKVVKNIGSITLNDDSTVIDYTSETDAAYVNEDLDIIFVISVNRKSMVKGVHTANIYVEGRFVGTTRFTLK